MQDWHSHVPSSTPEPRADTTAQPPTAQFPTEPYWASASFSAPHSRLPGLTRTTWNVKPIYRPCLTAGEDRKRKTGTGSSDLGARVCPTAQTWERAPFSSTLLSDLLISLLEKPDSGNLFPKNSLPESKAPNDSERSSSLKPKIGLGPKAVFPTDLRKGLLLTVLGT